MDDKGKEITEEEHGKWRVKGEQIVAGSGVCNGVQLSLHVYL